MYDVIVIGARCAGAPTAMLLARKGYRVLLADRASFPSDTLSTHYIHQPGIARLAAWGLLDRLVATGCPGFTGGSIDLDDVRLVGSPPPCDAIRHAYAPRRTVLDALLVEAAVEAGAELREGFAFREPLVDRDGVTGIRGIADGKPVIERARIVVGADGRNSLLAYHVDAQRYEERPALTCAYYSYWSGVDISAPELYLREGLAVVAFPTHDALTCVVVIRPIADFAAFRADSDAIFRASLAALSGLAGRVLAGRRVSRYFGTADLAGFFRKPYGAGWALVGDAAYHKDPLTGQGITDALTDAERVAAAIDDGFSGRRPLTAAFAVYESERNAERMPIYEFTHRLARLGIDGRSREIYRALAGNQIETDRLFGVFAGTVPVGAFFAEENVARIMAAVWPPAARRAYSGSCHAE